MFLSIPLLGDIVKGRGRGARKEPLEDLVDRMHYYVTVYILCVFALLVGSKQHFGNPIDCFISAEVDKVRTWQAYILDYCFMQGTYRYELGYNVTSHPGYSMTPGLNGRDPNDTKYISVKYYQWVPFYFAFQLLCFMLPDFFWVYIQSYLYIDMAMIVTESAELNNEKRASNRASKLSNIADYIFSYFYYRKIARRGLISSVFRLPAIATIFYGCTKVLYLLNAILQLYLTTYFLGFPDMHWGVRMMVAFMSKRTFPRMIGGVRIPNHGGLSHFPYFPLEMENNNNVHISSIQCMIPLNYINEKLFLFLWFWIVILIMITIVNIVLFFGSIISRAHREDVILGLLREKDDEVLMNDKFNLASKFVHGFMGVDGVLLTRFIKIKAGSMACRDVVQRVWQKYARERGAARTADSDDEWSVPYSENCYSGLPLIRYHDSSRKNSRFVK